MSIWFPFLFCFLHSFLKWIDGNDEWQFLLGDGLKSAPKHVSVRCDKSS